jgi:hypothetical protein
MIVGFDFYEFHSLCVICILVLESFELLKSGNVNY